MYLFDYRKIFNNLKDEYFAVLLLYYFMFYCNGECQDEDLDNYNLDVYDNIFDDYEMNLFEGGSNLVINQCIDEVSSNNNNNNYNKWIIPNEWKCENCSVIDGRNVYENVDNNNYLKSQLIAKYRLFRCPKEDRYISTTVVYLGCKIIPRPKITKVIAYNLLPELGYARVANGGVDSDHVVIELRSEKNSGFAYQIEIFGYV